MGVLVPGRGEAVALTVVATTPVVSALGPFGPGTFIDRLRASVFLFSQAGNTALRLGFSVSPSGDESLANYLAGNLAMRTRYAPGLYNRWHRLQLTSGGSVTFDVDIGFAVETGAQYVLVYHDLEDGTDWYDLFVSCRTRAVRRGEG